MGSFKFIFPCFLLLVWVFNWIAEAILGKALAHESPVSLILAILVSIPVGNFARMRWQARVSAGDKTAIEAQRWNVVLGRIVIGVVALGALSRGIHYVADAMESPTKAKEGRKY